MATDALLSDLCTICYTEKPKYRCPRCKTQTCSLPCYKRHQQRATCNGKRDPAEYLKKSQLATPVGIDRDYNYLKDVERTIDHASRETSDRGIGGAELSKAVHRSLHPDSKLQQYLIKNRIHVNRAPKGMSRQKANTTRSTKRDHIMWTVEWVHSDGQKDVRKNCLASTSVGDLYKQLHAEKRNAEKRKLAASDPAARLPPPKKRKRPETATESITSNLGIPEEGLGVESEVVKDTDETHEDEIGLIQNDTNPAPEGSKFDPAATKPEQQDPHQQPEFFYLLKPGTSSTSKVLIPTTPTHTLTESLRDKTVMEFPTIYVLPHDIGNLPADFMLESEYSTLRKGEEKELEDAMRTAHSQGYMDVKRSEPQPQPQPMDPQRILDMLKRDVTR